MYGFFTTAVCELWIWQQGIHRTRKPPKGRHMRVLREIVYTRDNGLCAYCGRLVPVNAFTVDHVIPLAVGGINRLSNMVVACLDCNQKKETAVAEADPFQALEQKFASLDSIRQREVGK